MRRLRHLVLLGRDLVGFGGSVGALWLVPLILVVLVTATLALAAHSAVPYVVYTFF